MTPQDIVPTLNEFVNYKGTLYRFVSAIIKKDKQGNIYYLAEIKDLNANSVCFVKLEAVDIG